MNRAQRRETLRKQGKRWRDDPETPYFDGRDLETMFKQMPLTQAVAWLNMILFTLEERGIEIENWADPELKLYRIKLRHGKPRFLSTKKDLEEADALPDYSDLETPQVWP